jgi:phage terminase large subunit
MEGINRVKKQNIFLVNDDMDLVRSMENYEFRKAASGEILDEPVKHDDHYPDALRYAVASHEEINITVDSFICGDMDEPITF